jgi:pyroglutamyl-peptidase
MMLVTAFGPFANIKRNPSEVLARALFGNNAVILPVSFAAVDEFLDNLPIGTDELLMLGVGRGDRGIRIERTASNRIGPTPDINGVSKAREKSDSVSGTLLKSVPACDCWDESEDAGGYLCNYVYYEAIKKHRDISSGFIHVPPFSAVPFPLQSVRLRRIVNLISQ